jgi:hypothetical protein
MEFLTTPITDKDSVNSFVDYLISQDQLFHFDDDPKDIIGSDNLPVFTESTALHINARLSEMLRLNLYEYAFEYALIKL